ncbi:bifunctional [glutamine synthetase] adenylyltransferase/[glutamine synthetase]-adenylyl-L-tyrosine phosphorylase [Arsenicicoccus sp. oral taxon 190]|uniref:bifunctional [glutamine synthetase] adenylyltransferase/[glutamine synthetase]-adenylyl-L-tyrosine phosphorylase n=1 Tax=Arsenicicoccus sp. oral taxon 190 TaxID=1658671 RepID=UPI00067A1D62|nr:bifunctional [glutamine synthetase] adenylyltransferase/[glutamine synthetase]-adenylyl-L-tyrosine phosphorylase [Arsenicicoccus sp. oral taxon 190]AKT52111.1 glutamine-synthetase adenylyltransferase [Arsenicicoccus sp. oral taxon 190]
MARPASTSGTLARQGFSDPERAQRLLEDRVLAGLTDDERAGLVGALSATADPDLALLAAVRLLEAAAGDGRSTTEVDALRGVLGSPGPERDRLLAVLGASSALGDHLVSHPGHWRRATGAQRHTAEELSASLTGAVRGLATGAALDALRSTYRQELLAVAALDLTSPDPLVTLPDTARSLADLAAAALEAAHVVACAEVPGSETIRLAVIGMGKCGGRELNYVSDVDVIFVCEPTDPDVAPGSPQEAEALQVGTQVASAVMRACATSTGEGTLWPVDAALRPEGKNGPLVRTVSSHLSYYQRWAKTWEFQALLKARHVAGDAELSRRYLEAVTPLVWQASSREHFVEDVQAMRRRVEEHVPAKEADRQLKLGPGGLRDVEFSVQLLQLVHGRLDETLRSGTTLEALAALAAGGYVARDDAAVLDESYRFLRSLEHRVQLFRLRRTHLMPTGPAELRRLGRGLHVDGDPAAEVEALWRRRALEVRRLHERLFYRPLLSAVARLSAGEARLTPEAAGERLAALGFRDPKGALRHLEALTEGVSRRSAIQRTLLPVMLGWFADGADPDAGLLSFRKVSDELGTTHWYLKMLRDEGSAAERLAQVLSSSRFAAELLERTPGAVAVLGDDVGLQPRTLESLRTVMGSAAQRKDTPEDAMLAVRGVRRHELFRVAVGDLVGTLDVAQVGEALTAITTATLEVALDTAVRKIEMELREPLGTRLVVIGMGRLGGAELGWSSDADVMFVHQPDPQSPHDDAELQRRATAVVQELRRLTSWGGPEPAVGIDADLRPEGKNGPLVRTLDSYRTYYERWALTWERQALLRARPVAGDAELAERFVELADTLRYPAEGLSAGQLRDIRMLKARMESERLPRGADRRTHLKLGTGGLSDVEWTVQVLQLQHAHEVPGLRTTGTLPAIEAAREAGLLAEDEATLLVEAWGSASRLRNAGMLWRGRPMESVPSDLRDAEGMARIVGRPPGEGQQLVDTYLRIARQARAVVDRLFYARSA